MNELYVDIDSVRISPPRIEFTEGIYTKKYQSRFILQNVGKHIVFVKIPQADTKDFEIEFLPQGLYLSPGLRIVRTVKLNYSKQCLKECMVSIHVNEKKYDFLMILKPSAVTISVSPKILDFGLLNAGNVHASHILVIENDSNKDQAFIVNLENCSKNIIVEPTKGRIKAHGIYEIGVKMISFVELDIDSRFHIRCAHQLIPVPVKGKIIISKLEALHINATPHFTLLEFPPTYFGLTSEVHLFLRNYSAIAHMFAAMGEVNNKRINISDMKDESVSFKFFNVFPMDGVFQSNETKLFSFRFSPVELNVTTKYTPFYFCTILVHRFKCFSLNKENVVDFNFDIISFASHGKGSSYDPSLRSSETHILELLSDSHFTLDESAYYKFNLDSVYDFIRIHLYATAEVPSVQVVPDEIIIMDMQLRKYENRTLKFKNLSRHLPIILKCKKFPFITLSCDRLHLRPLEKVEINVKIEAATIGTTFTNLIFDLMYYDIPKINKCKTIGQVTVKITFNVLAATKYPTPQLNLGLTPNYIREVGKYCHGIKFDTKLKEAKCITVRTDLHVDKSCKDLVAFPNDTQKSLRPCRSPDTYRTIFTRQSRYVAPRETEYELQVAEISRRNEVNNYYRKFISQQFIAKSKSTSAINSDCNDYDITTMKKVLCNDIKLCRSPLAFTYQEIKKGLFFLPPTPAEIDNIRVIPPIIKTPPIACYNQYDFKIKIMNKNNVPVRVMLCSDRLNLRFDEGSRYVVKKKQETLAKICYKSAHSGYYTSNLYLIINESAVLSVPILADVVPHALVVISGDITLQARDDHKYIELKNIINIDIPFYWNVGHASFIIEPSSGTVTVGGKMVCMVTYQYLDDGPTETTAQLLSGSINTGTVKLSIKQAPHKFLLTKSIIFTAVPLNIPATEMIIIKNCDCFSVKYYIQKDDLPKELKIFPMGGNIDPFGQVNIYITVQFTNCFKFDYVLKIYSNQGGILKVPVRGSVVYPDVVIAPSVINIPKIPASSVASAKFTVTNICSVLTKIRFDMSEYEEFQISESQYPWERTLQNEFTLKSKSTITLYVHFLPKGATSCIFYLPIVINDILGPPLFTDVTSIRANYYLIDFIENFEVLNIPVSLPCTKVRVLAITAKVQISKSLIQFKTLPARREAFSTITITNPQIIKEDVCIRIDELKHPVYIKRESGINEIFQGNAIVLQLNPNDSITFKVFFNPLPFEFGKYEVKLPVYLRSDNSTKVHNVIIIRAEYERPGISIGFTLSKPLQWECDSCPGEYVRYFYPLPLCFEETRITLKMTATNHLENCIVMPKLQSKNPTFKWTVLTDTKEIIDTKGTYTVDIELTAINSEKCVYYDVLEVTCSCGGFWLKYSTCTIENSLLTTYMGIEYFFNESLKANASGFPTYPLFPDTVHVLTNFLNECCKCAESWLHTQVFYGLWKYSIPDAMLPYLEPAAEQTIARQTQLSRLPILHILGNLLGPDGITLVQESEIPTDEIEKIKALYKINQKALELLTKCGASLPSVKPEQLLCSEHFFKYYEEVQVDKETCPFAQNIKTCDLKDFFLFSKQTWLDVIFQTYKCLYLDKLVEKYQNVVRNGNLKGTPLSIFFSSEHTKIRPTLYSDSESLILNWLQFHYNDNKNNVWKKGHHLPILKIDFHNNTLNDGLVFAVVIATYCPYLTYYIQDMYVPPSSQEEIYHNIVKVIQCLEHVNYTFTITPDQVINGCSIRLLMISVYLFDVLPYMHPVETITIDAGLSTVGTRKLEIFNQNNFPIAYKPFFIGSEDGCFTVAKQIFEIPKQKNIVININYFAKFAKKVECVLLLSGEIRGYRYANNKCVNLVGVPNLNYASSTITYTQELFKVEYYDFIVQSPYKLIATYDMQQTYETICRPLDLSRVIYHLDKDRIACARVVALNKSFDFDENGKCIVHGVVGAINNDTVHTWLYFRNATVGDFAVKFVSKIKDSTERELLKVHIPGGTKKIKEISDQLFLHIPNRNQLFFSCMKSLLIKLTEDVERELWKRVIETEMGMNILECLFLMERVDTPVNTPVQCKKRVYKVNVDQNADVILPEKIVFEDESNTGFAKIPLELKSPDKYPNNFLLTLESTEARRKRYYSVIFVSD